MISLHALSFLKKIHLIHSKYLKFALETTSLVTEIEQLISAEDSPKFCLSHSADLDGSTNQRLLKGRELHHLKLQGVKTLLCFWI